MNKFKFLVLIVTILGFNAMAQDRPINKNNQQEELLLKILDINKQYFRFLGALSAYADSGILANPAPVNQQVNNYADGLLSINDKTGTNLIFNQYKEKTTKEIANAKGSMSNEDYQKFLEQKVQLVVNSFNSLEVTRNRLIELYNTQIPIASSNENKQLNLAQKWNFFKRRADLNPSFDVYFGEISGDSIYKEFSMLSKLDTKQSNGALNRVTKVALKCDQKFIVYKDVTYYSDAELKEKLPGSISTTDSSIKTFQDQVDYSDMFVKVCNSNNFESSDKAKEYFTEKQTKYNSERELTNKRKAEFQRDWNQFVCLGGGKTTSDNNQIARSDNYKLYFGYHKKESQITVIAWNNFSKDLTYSNASGRVANIQALVSPAKVNGTYKNKLTTMNGFVNFDVKSKHIMAGFEILDKLSIFSGQCTSENWME